MPEIVEKGGSGIVKLGSKSRREALFICFRRYEFSPCLRASAVLHESPSYDTARKLARKTELMVLTSISRRRHPERELRWEQRSRRALGLA